MIDCSIFEYADDVVVVNYSKGILWFISEEDEDDKISLISIKRDKIGNWNYKHINAPDWLKNLDDDWNALVENGYKTYIKSLMEQR